jgi:hypothetical protein
MLLKRSKTTWQQHENITFHYYEAGKEVKQQGCLEYNQQTLLSV